ncbi:MAG: AI-2E family transporter [Lachnospiraceae bacterium]
MMKRRIDKRFFHLGLTMFLSISACICFYYVLFHGTDLSETKDAAIKVLLPIIDGIGLAYILNPMMNFYEKKCVIPLWAKMKLKDSKKKKGIVRSFSIFLTMISFLLILYSLLMLIVPQVINSLQSIVIKFPTYMNRINLWFSNMLTEYPDLEDLFDQYWIDIENWFTTQVLPTMQEVFSKVSTSLIGSVLDFLMGVFNFVIGIIISIYLLSGKELFCAQAKKIAYALLREERANNLINNMRFANKTFGGFLSGKILDSFLVGIFCFMGTSILKIPYALLISVIIGVTDVIPFFGPYLGVIPCALILIMIDPVKCVIFIIFILVLQQLDGNILAPKIIGDSTGLSSFWVIFAITVFGGLLGILGMFIGVPLFAVIYAAIKTLVNQRLIKKNLPEDTEYYIYSDYHTAKSDQNTGTEIKFVKKAFDHVVAENGREQECQSDRKTEETTSQPED